MSTQEKNMAELCQLFNDGKITVNGIRSALGLEPLSGGDVFRSKNISPPPAPTSIKKGGLPRLSWPDDF